MFNRRNFLRASALCTSAAALSATTPSSAKEEAPPRNKGYNYPLPSFKKGTRLVFIGDSITDMKWGRNEKDRNHYLGHSYVYLIASRLGVDMPDAQLDFYNRGHSGNGIQHLRSRWQNDVIDMKPDLLSVLIGVNDRRIKKGQSFDSKKWEDNYREILTQSRKANPELRIVLIHPFVLKSGWYMTKGGEYPKSREQIDLMKSIIQRLAKEFKAVQVPMQEVFDAHFDPKNPKHWIWDGVHPMPQGHELIARRWIEDVSKRWRG